MEQLSADGGLSIDPYLTESRLDEARRLVAGYVEHYNTIRLHSAIGYVTPADKLAGREPAIFAERDRKPDEARARRKAARQAARIAVARAEKMIAGVG
ncbi:MAG TPA: integrase core domain-containing protein [Phycisphaerae bacterium]|nr:integrase core domain-containing protein [Phycisphaerae bacterium]